MTGLRGSRAQQERWVTLPMGAQLAAQIKGAGESVAALVTRDTWCLEARRKVEYGQWPEALCEEIIAAGKAVEAFRWLLSLGEISAIGSHVKRGEPGVAAEPISSREWGTRYINIWKNELEAPAGSDPEHFPPIIDVRVSASDIELKLQSLDRNPTEVQNADDLAAIAKSSQRATPETSAKSVQTKTQSGKGQVGRKSDLGPIITDFVARLVDKHGLPCPEDPEWNSEAKVAKAVREQLAKRYPDNEQIMAGGPSESTMKIHIHRALEHHRNCNQAAVAVSDHS
jgi:hypothetical protein